MTKKLKDLIKKNPEPARGTVGVDPTNPWSAKSNLAEGMLDQYLLARGINPKFISTQTKISHAKSSAFLKWKQDHQFESVELDETLTTKHTPAELRKHILGRAEHMHKEIKSNGIHKNLHKEEVDEADAISFDIPLFIRMLELAREDVKDDMELHRITERLISIRNKGILTMDDYDFIAGIKKLKEEIDELAEGRMKDVATDKAETQRLNKMTTLQKFRAGATAREKKHSDIEKKSGGMTSAIDRLQAHLNKEDVYQDPQAATQTVFDGGNNTDDCSCNKKTQMSKSARMIKSLYKHLNMKEETYDWEKDDKAQDNGKKPKISVPDAKKSMGEQKPEARVIMSGGTTLTGEKRDTVEVDPLMKNRAGPPDSFTKEQGKKGQ